MSRRCGAVARAKQEHGAWHASRRAEWLRGAKNGRRTGMTGASLLIGTTARERKNCGQIKTIEAP